MIDPEEIFTAKTTRDAHSSNVLWQSNDYCWAIYDRDSRKLITWGRHGDDPVFMLTRLGYNVKVGTLPELDGGAHLSY